MLVLTPRQSQILATARQTGTVLVEELALRFEVTPQTIRKDLNEICNNRLLARTHGGAMLSSGVANMAYDSRRQIAASGAWDVGQRTGAEHLRKLDRCQSAIFGQGVTAGHADDRSRLRCRVWQGHSIACIASK